MTPTSPLAGIFTGLVDGAIVVLLVFVVAYFAGRRRHAEVRVHPVAEDGVTTPRTPEGELPKHS